MDWTSVDTVVVIAGAKTVTNGDKSSMLIPNFNFFKGILETLSPFVTSRCQSNFLEVLNGKTQPTD
jgi:hypothetical protein